ncbi:hypothetical protein E2C01_023062 [Portunus trituberculatus]|uniref:Uncharacterized protein n=1 Tax=Portunus trituberculatus TaxID=210409 RepID=A0A5B7E720_PORTR|nr:hypothetical protein [Portunus trituberculatus]
MKRNGGKYSLQQPIESVVRHGIKIYLGAFYGSPQPDFCGWCGPQVTGVSRATTTACTAAMPLIPPPAPSVLHDRISCYTNTYTMNARENNHR